MRSNVFLCISCMLCAMSKNLAEEMLRVILLNKVIFLRAVADQVCRFSLCSSRVKQEGNAAANQRNITFIIPSDLIEK